MATLVLALGIACGSSTSDDLDAPPTPELRLVTFDVAEPGWGDAPVLVHFTWVIESTTGRALTCLLDFDGDGRFDRRIEACKPDTLQEPLESLPSHSYETPGRHEPKLVVSDGVNTVEATQKIYSNRLKFAEHVVFPEKLPGFVKAEAVPNTEVVLTFASEAEAPAIDVGAILWGTSGDGYLIKATEVTKTGASVSIKGVQGQIEEAVEDGFLGARDVEPTYDDPRCLDEECQGATFEKLAAEPGQSPELGVQSIGVQSIGVRRDPLKVKGSGNLGLKVSLPSVGPFSHSIFVGLHIREFELEVRLFTVKVLTFDIVNRFTYQNEIVGQILKRDILLGSISLGTIAIGPVIVTPIVFPTLTIGATLKFGATAGLDVPVRIRYTPESGVQASIDPTRYGSAKEALEPIGTGAAFSAEATLSFPVKALVFGVAGPYVGPVLGLNGELRINTPTVNDNPCKKLTKTCATAKGFFAGEFGIGCPWIEKVDWKTEIARAEINLLNRCRDDVDDKCPDSGTTPDPKLHGIVKVGHRNTTSLDALFWDELTPSEHDRVVQMALYDRHSIDLPGVPKGTCGAPNAPPTIDRVPGVSVGTLALRDGPTVLQTFAAQLFGEERYYRGSVPDAPLDTVLDVTSQGTATVTGLNLPGAIRTAPSVTITSPDVSSGSADVPQGDLSLTFMPTQATHMTLRIGSTYCNVDPAAGTFVIPQNVLGGPGTKEVDVKLANVRETTAAGQRYLGIAESARAFFLNVQE